MTNLKLFGSCILIILLVSCRYGDSKDTEIFDGTFAQVVLEDTIPLEEYPTDKDSFLSIWMEISLEERIKIVEQMQNSFSSEIKTFSVYFSESNRFIFTQQDTSSSYIGSINDEINQWVVSEEELVKP
jgi:beta-glucanase (GH16 family)